MRPARAASSACAKNQRAGEAHCWRILVSVGNQLWYSQNLTLSQLSAVLKSVIEIAPGRAKTGKYDFAVPKKGMSKVVVSPDFEHDSVIFAGAVK
jgi:hypothetical protein